MSEQPGGGGLGIRMNPEHEDVDGPAGMSDSDRELAQMFEDEADDDEVLVETSDPSDVEPSGYPGAPEQTTETEPSEGSDLIEPGTTEEEIEQEATRLAGIYDTVPELENGYRSLQGAFTRVSQDFRRQEQEAAQQQAELEQLRAEHDELVKMLTQQMAESDPDFADRLARQSEIDQAVAARLQPIEEQLDGRFEQDEEVAARQAFAAQAEGAIRQFQAAHPDIPTGSPKDIALANTIRELRGANVPIDLRSVEHIEIALEATENPNLKAELMFSPNALNFRDGVARLRERAGATIAPVGGTPLVQGTRPPARAAGRNPQAHVEVGSGGAPVATAPGKQPDEFDEAMEWYKNDYSKGILFGQGR